MAKIAEAKEIEKKGYHFEEIEKSSKLEKTGEHPVIPSREEVSRRLLDGSSKSNRMLESASQLQIE